MFQQYLFLCSQVLPLEQVWLQTGVFVLAAGLILGALGALLPLSRFLDV